VPTVVVFWMFLLVLVLLGLAGFILPSLRPPRVAENDPHADAARYAAEIVVAADRAAATATCRRAEWEDAHRDVDAAWAAYEAADRAARRTAAGSAFPARGRPRRRGEAADRERYLHRAATAACRRHEISIAQLNEALAHRGWDPRLHPVAQEAALHRAVREHRFAAYRAATARERAAWETAELAAAALCSLRAEAQAAQAKAPAPTAGEQWWAEQWDATVPIATTAPTVTVPIPIGPAATGPSRSTVDSRHPIAA
jgi:hypothetical protein